MMAGAQKPAAEDGFVKMAVDMGDLISAYAYGTECFTGDQSAVLGIAQAFYALAEKYRAEGPIA
jgi:hypothetical protein